MSDVLTILGLVLILAGLTLLHPALGLVGVGAILILAARATERSL